MSEFPPTPAVSPDRRTRFARAVALAAIVLVPSLYSFHYMSFMDAKLTGLALGTMLLAIFASLDRVSTRDCILLFAPLAVLVVWAWIVVYAGQSASLDDSNAAACRYALVLLSALLILGAAPGKSVQNSIALSAVPVAVLALAQYAGFLRGMFPEFPEYGQRMYSVFGNQDLLGGYLALGLVLGFSLWLEKALSARAACVLFISAGPALLLSGSRSAWLAASVGTALAAWQGRAERRRISAAAAASLVVAVAVLLVAPGATWERFTGSFAAADMGYRIRLWIWDGTLYLIGQHPITGVGLGNFAFHSPRALGEILHERGPGVHIFNHIHTQHAHSDLLEIAAESGAIGMVLLAVFLTLIPRRRSAAWPALATAFTFSVINTTLHSPPHVLAILLLAGSLTEINAPSTGKRPLQGRMGAALFRCCAVLIVLWAMFALYPSAMHARAQALYEKDDGRAEDAYRRAAYLHFSHSASAAAELATLLANDRRWQEAMIAAEHAARNVDTGELYYLRAYLSERLSLQKAGELYRECFLRWPDHAPAYAGLLRNSAKAERELILAEAKRWLSPADYAALTAPPPGEAPSIPTRQ